MEPAGSLCFEDNLAFELEDRRLDIILFAMCQDFFMEATNKLSLQGIGYR